MTRLSVNPRGEEAVKAALIKAAGDKLAEVGPTALRVREVADLAGVNNGQVHHYFGGKMGLLKAAMSALAEEHWNNAHAANSESSDFPSAASLGQDERYWRATCRVVLEGYVELVQVEIEQGKSIPRAFLNQLVEASDCRSENLALKADFATIILSQLAWVAFEDLGYLLADIDERDQHQVRAMVQQRIEVAMTSLYRERIPEKRC
ncbi:hypothetical protein R50073_10280 [Maricurvus nonylphenolicus]|uniref:TetR family transcriptional regulator n=1 Tax=Maricurvus nonylphenolicus TaxID=1008307 RepID=UPI0036F3A2DD